MLSLGQLANSLNRKSKVRKTVIKIPSEIKYIKKISFKILESLEAYKLDNSIIFDIRLCVEEAVRNAIVHGNHCDKRKSARVVYWIKEGSLNMEVEDEGGGFDYKNLPDPTTNENLMKGSGRGVYLIKHLMDKIEFSETGNKLRMTKHLKL